MAKAAPSLIRPHLLLNPLRFEGLHTGTGCTNRRIFLKIAANKFEGSEISANWKQV